MRERAQHLFRTGDTVAGDAYSAETLGRTLSRRVAELADDPSTPLFFGRLTFDDEAEPDELRGHRYHIGRRHVTDDAGEPMVLDWRAPVSRAFYQASARDPQGIAVRRRFGFQTGELTGFEDEHLDRGEELGTSVADPHRRDRAPARRTHARHRRHHPARAGRAGAGRPRRDHLRAGRARHRQDGRRPAPRGLPALPAPRTAAPGRRPRGRAQPGLPALHLGRPAGARRDRRRAGAGGRPGGPGAGARRPTRPTSTALKQDARSAEVLARALAARIGRPTDGLLVSDGAWRWRISDEALRRIVDDVRREQPAVRGRPRTGTGPHGGPAAAAGGGSPGRLAAGVVATPDGPRPRGPRRSSTRCGRR